MRFTIVLFAYEKRQNSGFFLHPTVRRRVEECVPGGEDEGEFRPTQWLKERKIPCEKWMIQTLLLQGCS